MNPVRKFAILASTPAIVFGVLIDKGDTIMLMAAWYIGVCMWFVIKGGK